VNQSFVGYFEVVTLASIPPTVAGEARQQPNSQFTVESLVYASSIERATSSQGIRAEMNDFWRVAGRS
jgi:hypothetical protein